MSKLKRVYFLILGSFVIMSNECYKIAEDVIPSTPTIFLVGGFDSSSRHQHDVWSSIDGAEWKELTPKGNAAKEISEKEGRLFARMSRHKVVPFKNFLVIVGGQFHESGSSPQVKDDVWLSLNGGRWLKVKANTKEPAARYDHEVVVFKDSIFVIGGTNGKEELNDVWSSIDAENWIRIKANDDTGFKARDRHHVVVFKNKIFLIGGNFYERKNGNRKTLKINNDVWSSSNGKTWEIVNDGGNGSFPARTSYQVVVFQDTLFVIGGISNSKRRNDVWASGDGKTWKEVKPNDNKGFSARNAHQVVVLQDKMFLIGGDTGGSNYRAPSGYKNDVWSSVDGKTWKEVKPHNDKGFTARISHRVTVLNVRK